MTTSPPEIIPTQLQELISRNNDITIERCAQVAENYDMDGDLKDGLPKGWAGCRRMIAAAIRKLKDE